LRRISDIDVDFMGFSSTWSRPDWMICQVLAIPPPAVRPSVKHDSQHRSEDDITHILSNILKTNKTLQEKLLAGNVAENVIDDWINLLQYYIATQVDNKIPGTAPVAQRSGRPLKSIVALFNNKLVDFSFYHLKSGNLILIDGVNDEKIKKVSNFKTYLKIPRRFNIPLTPIHHVGLCILCV
jgi:DNA-directed RNA polymerase beta' subunit